MASNCCWSSAWVNVLLLFVVVDVEDGVESLLPFGWGVPSRTVSFVVVSPVAVGTNSVRLPVSLLFEVVDVDPLSPDIVVDKKGSARINLMSHQ